MRDVAFYLSWLRVCAKCGRGIFWRTRAIDLYCERCWLIVDQQRNRSYSLLQDSSGGALSRVWIYSLFTWAPSTEAHVKPLLYSLKRGGLPEAYSRLAEAFSFEMALAQDLKAQRGKLVFVVPPSSRAPRDDHAWLWANELAQIWGGEVWRGLETVHGDLRTQKSKTRAERLEKQYVVNGAIPQGKFFIFVDDVMTSGATAEAAWRALKEPHCFQVWVIAFRPKLAGFSTFC